MFPRYFALSLAFLPAAYGLKVAYSQDLPQGAGIENLALRPCGNALLTDNSGAHIYEVEPVAGSAPKLLHSFNGTHGASGITESSNPDEFFVVTGHYSFELQSPIPGSYAIHRLSFDNRGQPVVKQLSPLGVAQPNGLLHVPHTSDVLIADSYAGYIWKFNTVTLALTLYFDHPMLKPQAVSGLIFGVNGIKFSQEYLYFSNTNLGSIYRMRATGREDQLHGIPELVAQGTPADDFIIDDNGDIYLAQQLPANSLGYLSRSRFGMMPETIVGGPESNAVAGCTAVARAKPSFEQTQKLGRTLLVPVNGNLTAILNGDTTQRAKLGIVYLDQN
ncbi:unnamed protein product [Clonostachys byssicola]|uniref:Uncharacterized protein n=1 Tax=Clonostachys byssicola TaxID=160290 RepID=A0A9N9UKE4_9HYPO|nr:unnamed protein product [Clonostachys byssicola]